MRPSCGQCPADLPGTGRSSLLSSTCVHSSVYSPHARLLVSCTGSRHVVAQALEGCAHAGCTVLDHRMHWALRPTVLPSPCVCACGHVPSSPRGGARCRNHIHSRQCPYSRPDCYPGRPLWRPAPPAHGPLVAAVRGRSVSDPVSVRVSARRTRLDPYVRVACGVGPSGAPYSKDAVHPAVGVHSPVLGCVPGSGEGSGSW